MIMVGFLTVLPKRIIKVSLTIGTRKDNTVSVTECRFHSVLSVIASCPLNGLKACQQVVVDYLVCNFRLETLEI